MSAAVAGASPFTPPVAANQPLRTKSGGVDKDHDGDAGGAEKSAAAPKLSPPVDPNRGRKLDVLA